MKGNLNWPKREEQTADMVFEGVVIFEGTRSAMPARKRITNEDEMGSSEGGIRVTLSGKITLAQAGARHRRIFREFSGAWNRSSSGVRP
jgi:hypothetical protein